jgi:BlaI family transcriptional regulator, penicillinase repressor
MARTRQAADRQEPPAETTGGMTGPEWAIMKVVWEKEPCAAGTVQEALESSHHWAYSTVKTTMDRMAAKGLLATQAIRNLTLFSAQISRADAQRSELRRMIGRAFDGALTPLIQFLAEEEQLTRDEIAELRKLIKRRAQS